MSVLLEKPGTQDSVGLCERILWVTSMNIER